MVSLNTFNKKDDIVSEEEKMHQIRLSTFPRRARCRLIKNKCHHGRREPVEFPKLKKLYDVESFSERGLQEWAKDENRKIRNKTLCELHDRGFSSSYELDRYLEQLYTTLDEYSRAYDVFSTKKAENEVLLKYVEIYNEYKDIYDYYNK